MLAQLRAQACVDALIDEGVPSSQLYATYKGMGGQLHIEFVPRATSGGGGASPGRAASAGRAYHAGGASEAEALAFKLMRGVESDCVVCVDDDADSPYEPFVKSLQDLLLGARDLGDGALDVAVRLVPKEKDAWNRQQADREKRSREDHERRAGEDEAARRREAEARGRQEEEAARRRKEDAARRQQDEEAARRRVENDARERVRVTEQIQQQRQLSETRQRQQTSQQPAHVAPPPVVQRSAAPDYGADYLDNSFGGGNTYDESLVPVGRASAPRPLATAPAAPPARPPPQKKAYQPPPPKPKPPPPPEPEEDDYMAYNPFDDDLEF